MELLNKYSKNISSQYGEDGIIEFLIKTSSVPINKTSFECGASDGITNSNTYNLWANNNYNGVLVEAAKDRFELLNNKFSKFSNLTIVNDHLYFNISRFLLVLFKKRTEPYKTPSMRVKKELEKAKIYF